MDTILSLQALEAEAFATAPANSSTSIACDVKYSTVSYQCGGTATKL